MTSQIDDVKMCDVTEAKIINNSLTVDSAANFDIRRLQKPLGRLIVVKI